jgi:hypothetical protein
LAGKYGEGRLQGSGEIAMTEQEWIQCDNSQKMLEFLPGPASDRKLRLLAVACCRRIWRAADYKDVKAASESMRRMGSAQTSGESHAVDFLAWPPCNPRSHVAYYVSTTIARSSPDCFAESSAQCCLLRDIFHNPFQPMPTLNPAWLTWNGGIVPTLAQAIYDKRAFNCLPVLADALEEAGCDNEEIMAHCRGPGPHVKGCWVVDLVLAKE